MSAPDRNPPICVLEAALEFRTDQHSIQKLDANKSVPVILRDPEPAPSIRKLNANIELVTFSTLRLIPNSILDASVSLNGLGNRLSKTDFLARLRRWSKQ